VLSRSWVASASLLCLFKFFFSVGKISNLALALYFLITSTCMILAAHCFNLFILAAGFISRWPSLKVVNHICNVLSKLRFFTLKAVVPNLLK